jgi:hypothetical protein
MFAGRRVQLRRRISKLPPTSVFRSFCGHRGAGIPGARVSPAEGQLQRAALWPSNNPLPRHDERHDRRVFERGATVFQPARPTPGLSWREAAPTRISSIPPFFSTYIDASREEIDQEKCEEFVKVRPYCAKAASTALTKSVDSGVTADSKRLITLPFLSTRNFVKFHLMSPPVLGFADLSVRYW